MDNDNEYKINCDVTKKNGKTVIKCSLTSDDSLTDSYAERDYTKNNILTEDYNKELYTHKDNKNTNDLKNDPQNSDISETLFDIFMTKKLEIDVKCPQGHEQVYSPVNNLPERPRTKCKICNSWIEVKQFLSDSIIEEQYLDKYQSISNEIFRFNNFIINKINTSFEIDIFEDGDRTKFLGKEFLNEVNKLTKEYIETIFHKYNSYKKATDYFITLIAQDRFNLTIRHLHYIASSIMFYMNRIKNITKKPSFSIFSLSDFNKIFPSDFNVVKFSEIFTIVYEDLVKITNKPIFFNLLFSNDNIKNNNFEVFYDYIITFLELYSSKVKNTYKDKINTDNLKEKATNLLNTILNIFNNNIQEFYKNIPEKDTRYISAFLVFYFVKLDYEIIFESFSKLLHVSRRRLSQISLYLYDLLKKTSKIEYIEYRTEQNYNEYKLKINKYSKTFPNDYNLKPLEIFIDLLNSIDPLNLDSALIKLVNELRNLLGGYILPIHFYNCLSYISYCDFCIENHLKIPSKKDYAKNKNIVYHSFPSLLNTFIKILTKSNYKDKYSFSLVLISSRDIDESCFTMAYSYFLKIFIDEIFFLDIFKIECEKPKVINNIYNILEELIKKEGFKNFFKGLDKKARSPKYVALFFIFFYFSFVQAYLLSAKFFVDILNSSKISNIFSINYGEFKRIHASIINKYYKSFKADVLKNKLLNIKFNHQKIEYIFRLVESRLKLIDNEIRTGLSSIFYLIKNASFPNEVFNNSEYRPSNFYLKGSIENNLKTHIIKEHFNKFLIEYHDFYDLCKHAKLVRKFYLKRYLKNPKHDPILTYILNNNTKSISIETPVWIKFDVNKFLPGHIDLIMVIDDFIYICDFKQEYNDIIKFIPQIALYANIIKKMLEKSCDIKKFSIRCLGFSYNGAIEFDINIMKQIKNFIKNINQERNNDRISTLDKQDFEEVFGIFYSFFKL